jgi:hypothetical protein
MNEPMHDDDEYEEALGPSLAMPPLYALRTAARCPACGEMLHVYALGCSAFHDAEDLRPVERFHFLRLTTSVPESLLTRLKRNCPSYYLDQEEQGDARRYVMNHCRCGAKLDDDYLHGDVGSAFWPDTPGGYRQFKLFRLPIEEAIPVETSYMLGGGEYLDTKHAELW